MQRWLIEPQPHTPLLITISEGLSLCVRACRISGTRREFRAFNPERTHMSKALAQRVTVLEAALREIVTHSPEAEPEAGHYDDTESAYNNGMDVGAWEQGQRAIAALNSTKPSTDREIVILAISKLREARDLLVAAAAPRAAERVRLALSSAEGAERNAGYREVRAQRRALGRFSVDVGYTEDGANDR